MTNPQHGTNPYQSPQGGHPQAPAQPPGQLKPKWFTAVTVGAIALPMLMMLGALSSVFSAAGGGPAMPANLPAGAGAEALEQLMRELGEAGMPLVTGLVGLCQLAAGAFAAWAGHAIYRLRGAQIKNFRNAALSMAMVTLLGGVVVMVLQVRMAGALERFGDALTKGAPGLNMGAMMQTSMIAGTVISALWALASIAFWLYARSYVHKPEVRAYLGV